MGFGRGSGVNFFLCVFFDVKCSFFFSLGVARCATSGRYWVTLQRNDEVVTTYVSFQFLLISSHESMSLSTHGVFPILHRRPKLVILCYAPQHTRVYKRLLLHYESQKKWNCFSKFFGGSRDGRCRVSTCLPPMWPGFDSRTRRHMWVEFVVGSRPCSEGSSPGSPVFLPPQKPTFPNSNSIWNPRATGLSVVRLLSVTLVKQS